MAERLARYRCILLCVIIWKGGAGQGENFLRRVFGAATRRQDLGLREADYWRYYINDGTTGGANAGMTGGGAGARRAEIKEDTRREATRSATQNAIMVERGELRQAIVAGFVVPAPLACPPAGVHCAGRRVSVLTNYHKYENKR
jgi:hypothetical protein